MRKWVNNILILVILLSVALGAIGQKTSRSNRKNSNFDRKKIEKQILLSNKLLKETNYKQDKSLNELALLNEQIHLRESLLGTFNQEIETTSNQIIELNEIICSMQEDMEEVKIEYAKTAQVTYKTLNNHNFILAILSSSSFMEAYYRTLYLRQFSKFRKIQLQRLKSSTGFLTKKITELEEQNRERETLLAEKQQELQRLVSSKMEQNQLFFSLKDKESKYRSKLNNQRKSLQAVIRRVDAGYRVKSKAKAPKVNTSIGKSFAKQRGFLSWPIQSNQGIIIGKFGKTRDPYGNEITNDGVFIRTPIGAQVRSIFKGKVTGVQKVPLSGTMVIIEHGLFRSVYANLSGVSVRMGDDISAKQIIGTVRTDERTQETLLNFLIYKLPGKFVDPMRWVIER